RLAPTTVLVLALLPTRPPAPAATTRVIVLGVNHSIQLVSPQAQPAAFRAFFDRVAPDGIAIERDPDSFARGDHYEFTYEIQYLTVPYAREAKIPLFPVDWIPPVEDQLLAFGLDLDRPPPLRPAAGFQGFLTFPDTGAIHTSLFFADQAQSRADGRAWYSQPAAQPSRDFPRRLYLYRTSLQARRIARAAAELRGKTLLVVIGSLHKDEIEQILASDSTISLVQPSQIGALDSALTRRATRQELVAIASFNLLGLQPRFGPVDWNWMAEVVHRLKESAPGPESELLEVRLLRLTNRLDGGGAVERYRQLANATAKDISFSWTGVKFRDRVDSYFDPFGNLSVQNRARLEWARELLLQGRRDEAARVRQVLESELPPAQRVQLGGYWGAFVEDAAAKPSG
ncbi:MAG: hypothetical protein ABI877_14785, partial [Gemmatimonadaceae bacterium]